MNILIIEDEYSLADAVAETLKSENYSVCIKTNGEDGEDEALTGTYDLILLDVMLPGKNGFKILKYLREEKIKTPVIMLTAKSEIDDKLDGLEHGADDYVTKPFSMRELVARIKAVLKRTNDIEDANVLEFGDISLDIKNAKLKCNNNELQISGKELELQRDDEIDIPTYLMVNDFAFFHFHSSHSRRLDFGRSPSFESSSSNHPMLLSLSSGGIDPSPKPMQNSSATNWQILDVGGVYALFIWLFIICFIWYLPLLFFFCHSLVGMSVVVVGESKPYDGQYCPEGIDRENQKSD